MKIKSSKVITNIVCYTFVILHPSKACLLHFFYFYFCFRSIGYWKSWFSDINSTVTYSSFLDNYARIQAILLSLVEITFLLANRFQFDLWVLTTAVIVFYRKDAHFLCQKSFIKNSQSCFWPKIFCYALL